MLSDGDYAQTRAASADASVHQGVLSTNPGSLRIGNIIYNNSGVAGQEESTLLDSLWFGGINLRQFSVKNADAETCQWLLDHAQYCKWKGSDLDNTSHRLLWIKGVAGAGKSTLMKYAINQETDIGDFDFVLSYFFDAQSETNLEKSTEGMYRTLLVQLLSQMSKDDLLEFTPAQKDLRGKAWPLEQLIKLLKKAIRQLHEKRMAIFIDALDECDEDEMRSMVRAFEALLLESDLIRLCFSSRPYPHVTAKRAMILDLTLHSSHVESTHKYIRANLEIGESSVAQEVEKDLIRKSGGVFIWVCLVVTILNREFDKGRLNMLRDRVRQVPVNLQRLYTDILAHDEEDSQDRLLCFQALVAADGRISMEELWWKIQLGRQEKFENIMDSFLELHHTDIERYINHISRGLVHCTYDYTRRARFVHESIREYGLKHDGFSSLDKGSPNGDFETRSHAYMRECCSRLVSASLLRWMCQGQTYPINTRVMGLTLRSYEYNVCGIWHRMIGDSLWQHAERAHNGGISQSDWTKTLDLKLWVTLMGLFEKYYDYKERKSYLPWYRENTSLLFILMANGCQSLICSTQSPADLELQRYGLAEGPERWQTPVHVALTQGHLGSIKAVLSLSLNFKATQSGIRPYLEELAKAVEDRGVRRRMGWPLVYSQGLLNIADANPRMAVFCLLTHINDEELEESRVHLLLEAAKQGFQECLETMLDQSISSEAIDLKQPDTLKWAESRENRSLAEKLVEAGVSICANYEESVQSAFVQAVDESLLELQMLVKRYIF